MTLEAKAEPAGDTERGGDGGGKVKPEATTAAKAAEVTVEAKVTDSGIDDSGGEVRRDGYGGAGNGGGDSGDSGGGGGAGDGDGGDVGDGDGDGADGVGGDGGNYFGGEETMGDGWGVSMARDSMQGGVLGEEERQGRGR